MLAVVLGPKADHSLRSATGSPDSTGGRSASRISNGFAETNRTHGAPASSTAGYPVTLSVTTTSGRTSSQMSITRSCEYCSPATSASQMGFVTVSIWAIVGLRNSGAVTRMNSAHGSAEGSAFSSGGAIRIMRSSNPLASRTPSNDSSTTKTIRCPRSSSTLAIATQLLVGPQAPGSGKNAIVLASVMCVVPPVSVGRARSAPQR